MEKSSRARKTRAIWYLCKQNKINLIYFWTNDHRNKYELINQLLLLIVNSTPKLEWRFLFGEHCRWEWCLLTFGDIHRDVVMNGWCHFQQNRWIVPSVASTMCRLFIWFHILIALLATSLLPPSLNFITGSSSNTWRQQFVTLIYISLRTKITLRKTPCWMASKIILVEMDVFFVLACGQPKHGHLILTKNRVSENYVDKSWD